MSWQSQQDLKSNMFGHEDDYSRLKKALMNLDCTSEKITQGGKASAPSFAEMGQGSDHTEADYYPTGPTDGSKSSSGSSSTTTTTTTTTTGQTEEESESESESVMDAEEVDDIAKSTEKEPATEPKACQGWKEEAVHCSIEKGQSMRQLWRKGSLA